MDVRNIGIRPSTTLENEESLLRSPEYITLSRTLERYQYLILQIPTSSEKLDLQLAPLQAKLQAELRNPLPFHRMQWLRTVEGARNRLIKLEQSAQQIKAQRAKKDVARHLGQKRLLIRKLRNKIEEIGREAETSRYSQLPRAWQPHDEAETMYDVLQQIRASKRQKTEVVDGQMTNSSISQPARDMVTHDDTPKDRDQLFGSSSTTRRRQGKNDETIPSDQAKTSGYSTSGEKEAMLAHESKGQEKITGSMLDMAKQLRQSQEQLHASLGQEDKNLIDRAMEGLEQNSTAMNIASRGMKTLQRMSESESWLQRLKLQLIIVGMWAAAVLLVFAGPKLRF
ncbi:hypothetical protein LTR66_016575 [Elasticomyces elasticus]|nr:hypothetical protein LTR66_016575 [Elasticomyces elasticus]